MLDPDRLMKTGVSLQKALLISLSLAYLSFGCRQAPADHDHAHEEAEEAASTEPHDDQDHEHEEAADHAELNADALSIIELKTARASRVDFEETVSATGKILNNQNNEIHISTLVPGRVNEALVDWGERVTKGQTVACIESIELGKKRADYEKSIAELDLATAEFERVERLYKNDAVSEKRLLEARAALRSARINLEYEEKMLLLTGLKKEEILNPPHEHPTIPGCSFHLTSPINGVVIERNIVKGEKIEPGTCVYKILDISSVWVETDIYEKDLAHVKAAKTIKVTVPAFPGRTFTGRIVYLGATLDETTRTVKMRSVIPNPDYDLKPGMFAEVRIVVGSHKKVVAIPMEAVIAEGETDFVFVKEGDDFHRHEVQVGHHNEAGLVPVFAGLSAGAEVVVQGHHQIRSRLLMEGVDPHAGHTH
jgi:cobalt-zinc-cadmium efflux system membrane fusion protein